jgi:23S rRNA pseudouridine1911/1915/1917 synthase
MRRQRVRAAAPVVFEDDAIVVADKPPGLLTIGTSTERRNTLYARLYDLAHRRRPPEKIFVVHRLDREASGLLVFAKTPQAKHALQRQFRDRTAGRRYVAWVHGTVRQDELTLRSWLAENAARRVWDAGEERGGKLAITHLRVLARRPGRTLVEASLETGRKHQIRVQLASAGHPIEGDRRYGPPRPASSRLALHAAHLRFVHPVTGASMAFASPPPFAGATRWRPPRDERASPARERGRRANPREKERAGARGERHVATGRYARNRASLHDGSDRAAPPDDRAAHERTRGAAIGGGHARGQRSATNRARRATPSSKSSGSGRRLATRKPEASKS